MIVMREGVSPATSVSRETFGRLKTFEGLIRKWNPAINLVSRSSIAHIWERHIVDSTRLHPMFPERSRHCVDFGSGGGFPGIVLAIQSAESHPNRRFTMVESDHRKATFLREVVRELGLDAVVHAERVESLPALQADVITARALAPLDRLLKFAHQHLKLDGVCLFPKGETFASDVATARERWSFDVEAICTPPPGTGAILRIQGIADA